MIGDWGSAATDFSLDPVGSRSSLCLLCVNGVDAGICRWMVSVAAEEPHLTVY